MRLRIIFFLLFSTQQLELAAQVSVGEELLKAIHFTYRDKVPDSVFFSVEVDIYQKDDLKRTENWKEIITSPGVRVVSKDNFSRDSIIYRNDSIHIHRFGELIYDHHQIDLLTLMTIGIYWEEPDHFLKVLDGMNIDLAAFGEGRRYARKNWIIGAETHGDGNEIWIDQEDLVVSRVFYYNFPQKKIQDIEWEEYQVINGFKLPLKVKISEGLDRLIEKRYIVERMTFP